MHDQNANKPQIFGKKMIQQIKLDFAALNATAGTEWISYLIYIYCSSTAHYQFLGTTQNTWREKREAINKNALRIYVKMSKMAIYG